MDSDRACGGLSLICFFSVCFFAFAAHAETAAGYTESKTSPIPQVEVQTVDVPVPQVLLLQLKEQKKTTFFNMFRGNQYRNAEEKAAGNLFIGFKSIKPAHSYNINQEIADNSATR